MNFEILLWYKEGINQITKDVLYFNIILNVTIKFTSDETIDL